MEHLSSQNLKHRRNLPSSNCGRTNHLLALFVAGYTSTIQTELLRSHLKTCRRCSKKAKKYEDIKKSLSHFVPDKDIQDRFSHWVKAAARKRRVGIGNRILLPHLWNKRTVFWGAALAVLCLLIGLGVWHSKWLSGDPLPNGSWLKQLPSKVLGPIALQDEPIDRSGQAEVEHTSEQLESRMQSFEWMVFNHFKKKWRRTTFSPITYVVVRSKGPTSGYKAKVLHRYFSSLIKQYNIQQIVPPRHLKLHEFLPRSLLLVGHRRRIKVVLSALQRQGMISVTTHKTPWKRIRWNQQRTLVHFVKD